MGTTMLQALLLCPSIVFFLISFLEKVLRK